MDAAVKHFEESLRIGRRLMALDPNETQIRFNHAMAAWRLGNALGAPSPRTALERYDEAAALLRPMILNRAVRDIALVGVLADSTFALRAVGRSSEIEQRMEEAAGICEPYRARNAAVYGECSEPVSRAAAGVALAQGRTLDAIAAHREWLKVAEGDKTTERAKDDIYSAFVLGNRYRLLRDALLAAGMKAEADGAERNRQSIVAFWKTKLSGRNDAEAILMR
jgi:predicted nucleic acid-binding protein